VNDLIIEDGRCKGVVMADGTRMLADSVVLTTGTFLGGRCHIGQEGIEAGRFMRNSLNKSL